MQSSAHIYRLWVEFGALFVLLPAVLWWFNFKILLVMILWTVTLIVILCLHNMPYYSFKKDWNAKAINPTNMKLIGLRFGVCLSLMVLFTLIQIPERLLSFPLERPAVWATVMLFYPLLSVLPQEVIYRSFFFARYASLFPPRLLLVANGLAFGLGHAMLNNWVALVFSAVGGVIFAQTYHKHRSLALVSLEHAVYGCVLFTLGLGWYFYHGAR